MRRKPMPWRQVRIPVALLERVEAWAQHFRQRHKVELSTTQAVEALLTQALDAAEQQSVGTTTPSPK